MLPLVVCFDGGTLNGLVNFQLSSKARPPMYPCEPERNARKNNGPTDQSSEPRTYHARFGRKAESFPAWFGWLVSLSSPCASTCACVRVRRELKVLGAGPSAVCLFVVGCVIWRWFSFLFLFLFLLAFAVGALVLLWPRIFFRLSGCEFAPVACACVRFPLRL